MICAKPGKIASVVLEKKNKKWGVDVYKRITGHQTSSSELSMGIPDGMNIAVPITCLFLK
jgi:hypothetical protein